MEGHSGEGRSLGINILFRKPGVFSFLRTKRELRWFVMRPCCESLFMPFVSRRLDPSTSRRQPDGFRSGLTRAAIRVSHGAAPCSPSCRRVSPRRRRPLDIGGCNSRKNGRGKRNSQAAQEIYFQSRVVVLYLFLCRRPGGDRRADRRSFEPRRFGRRDRGARGPDGKNGVARKWRRKGLKRLNPRPEMVWSRKTRTHKMWYTGTRLAVRDSG